MRIFARGTSSVANNGDLPGRRYRSAPESLERRRRDCTENTEYALGQLSKVDVAARAIQFKGRPAVLIVVQEASARNGQRNAEEKLRHLFENAVEGIFQSTPKGRFITANPALARMCGYSSPADLKASVRDIDDALYVDPRRRVEFKRLMEERGAVEAFEYQVRKKDGVKIWVSVNVRAVYGRSGRIMSYEGTVEDITDRKRSELERQVTTEIVHVINVTDNLDDLLRQIHGTLEKVLYVGNCFVALHEPSADTFQFPFFVDTLSDHSQPKLEKAKHGCVS
ncbi:MAG TPA: PAS domain S-box protein [Candidatus Acidoferrales bacterium]|nr:PAS domain S-box protein [Candidatus Acidoferrales bacterium]